MKESRKEFIKELYDGSCDGLKKRFEKEFPKLFKKEVLTEARKRYKNGDVFISAYSGCELIIQNIDSIKLDIDGDIIVDGHGFLYSGSKWAEIVDTITKEQAEKELGKTILN